MESQIDNQASESKGKYWVITLVSLAACILLLLYSPEWFWVTLPFLLTYFVKAIDMM